jgi:hypothetical protein
MFARVDSRTSEPVLDALSGNVRGTDTAHPSCALHELTATFSSSPAGQSAKQPLINDSSQIAVLSAQPEHVLLTSDAQRRWRARVSAASTGHLHPPLRGPKAPAAHCERRAAGRDADVRGAPGSCRSRMRELVPARASQRVEVLYLGRRFTLTRYANASRETTWVADLPARRPKWQVVDRLIHPAALLLALGRSLIASQTPDPSANLLDEAPKLHIGILRPGRSVPRGRECPMLGAPPRPGIGAHSASVKAKAGQKFPESMTIERTESHVSGAFRVAGQDLNLRPPGDAF